MLSAQTIRSTKRFCCLRRGDQRLFPSLVVQDRVGDSRTNQQKKYGSIVSCNSNSNSCQNNSNSRSSCNNTRELYYSTTSFVQLPVLEPAIKNNNQVYVERTAFKNAKQNQDNNVGVTVVKVENEQRQRFKALREELKQSEDNDNVMTLQEFSQQTTATEVETISSATTTSSSMELPVPERPIRKKAPAKSPKILPKPSWLKAVPATSAKYYELRDTVRELGLATVCEEAKCPNIGDCWSGSSSSKSTTSEENDEQNHHGTATATIMIMGDTCTRGCRFCAVKTSRKPGPLDPLEPEKVANAITQWGLDYVVLTSVDRDDIIPDQGSLHFRQVIQALKQRSYEKKKNLFVEALTPDFQGDETCIYNVATSGLDVYAHNIETVERLTPRVRDHRATYKQSLNVLEYVKSLSTSSSSTVLPTTTSLPLLTKTSIMLGLGETHDDIVATLHDLRNVDVNVVTFGQYLQPTRHHLPVQEYIHPDTFHEYQILAENMGFTYVASGPLVRSSYKAGEYYIKNYLLQQQQEKQQQKQQQGETIVNEVKAVV